MYDNSLGHDKMTEKIFFNILFSLNINEINGFLNYLNNILFIFKNKSILFSKITHWHGTVIVGFFETIKI